MLSEGSLHLLVVTRSDTAAGLGYVRFLGEDQTALLTLPRVELEYLRPLLSSIAADDAHPAVVSNSVLGTICANVWSAIRQRARSSCSRCAPCCWGCGNCLC